MAEAQSPVIPGQTLDIAPTQKSSTRQVDHMLIEPAFNPHSQLKRHSSNNRSSPGLSAKMTHEKLAAGIGNQQMMMMQEPGTSEALLYTESTSNIM